MNYWKVSHFFHVMVLALGVLFEAMRDIDREDKFVMNEPSIVIFEAAIPMH